MCTSMYSLLSILLPLNYSDPSVVSWRWLWMNSGYEAGLTILTSKNQNLSSFV